MSPFDARNAYRWVQATLTWRNDTSRGRYIPTVFTRLISIVAMSVLLGIMQYKITAVHLVILGPCGASDCSVIKDLESSDETNVFPKTVFNYADSQQS